MKQMSLVCVPFIFAYATNLTNLMDSLNNISRPQYCSSAHIDIVSFRLLLLIFWWKLSILPLSPVHEYTLHDLEVVLDKWLTYLCLISIEFLTCNICAPFLRPRKFNKWYPSTITINVILKSILLICYERYVVWSTRNSCTRPWTWRILTICC